MKLYTSYYIWFASLLTLGNFFLVSPMNQVLLNSTLFAKSDNRWLSEDHVFGFGFVKMRNSQFILAIFYNSRPTLVWAVNRDQPVSENAFVILGQDGNIILIDEDSTIWMSGTTGLSIQAGELQNSGNLVLYNTAGDIVWQSFACPTNTLLPGQELTESLNLTSAKSSVDYSSGYFSLTITRAGQFSKLSLSYSDPANDSACCIYWSASPLKNMNVSTKASIDSIGNFLMTTGLFPDSVYFYNNTNDFTGGQKRLILDYDGNLKLMKWDPQAFRWIERWRAVNRSCAVARCGNCWCKEGIKGRASHNISDCDDGLSRSYASPVKRIDYRENLSTVILGCVGAAAAAAAVILIFFLWRTPLVIPFKLCPSSYNHINRGPLKFSYYAMKTATNDFAEFLGSGAFGGVYKGTLLDGTIVAVKRLEKTGAEDQFLTEVNTIGTINHVNLVRLHGFCSDGIHRMLVYEYLANGSLEKWLFRGKRNYGRCLEWEVRMKIAIGTAQGLAYLHEQCRETIMHCDIKPENILLDPDFGPKVSDFGMAWKVMMAHPDLLINNIRGTKGYVAPEWVLKNRPITVKADVYSYGMVLLEIISGRKNLDTAAPRGAFFFPSVAYKEMMKESGSKIVDPRLGSAYNEAEAMRAVKVALWCIQDEISERPSMGNVVKMLEGVIEVTVPSLPQLVIHMDDALSSTGYSGRFRLSTANIISMISEDNDEQDNDKDEIEIIDEYLTGQLAK